jgi:thiosulfate dehydrogenase [quinone] large subunit
MMTLHKPSLPFTGHAVSGAGAVYEEDVLRSSSARKVLAGLRIVIGWYFLWAFIDKIFGFGYLTPAGKGLIDGGHPARGFLGGVIGWFSGVFQPIGNMGPAVDFLFMLALLGIGLALILGVGLKVTAIAGPTLLGLMYLAEFPLGVAAGTYTNPLFDDHWIMGLAIIVFALVRAGDQWGLGKWWVSKVGDGWLR